MSVQIQVRPDGDTTVVTLRGVAEGTVLNRLGDTIPAASPDGELLLLDLSELTVADPSELRALMDELTRHRARQCAVRHPANTATLADASPQTARPVPAPRRRRRTHETRARSRGGRRRRLRRRSPTAQLAARCAPPPTCPRIRSDLRGLLRRVQHRSGLIAPDRPVDLHPTDARRGPKRSRRSCVRTSESGRARSETWKPCCACAA